MNYQMFYEKLGCLFYSIAAADKAIRPEEEEKLKKELNNIWLPLEESTDTYGSDAAYYIFFSFETLKEQNMPAEDAFQEFKAYYNGKNFIPDAEIKSKIIKTALTIAEAYANKNKSELGYVSRLGMLLGSIQ